MIIQVLIALLFSSAASADLVPFDKDRIGELPKAWKSGTTGSGAPKWQVVRDTSASSKPNVLMQSGTADFPWAVRSDVALTDGFVETEFRPISGEEDQAGGVVWRFKSGDNYYVARGNSIEGNVSVYYVENGKRKTVKYVDAPVRKEDWNRLRVEFAGKHIRIFLNGKNYIELDDDHIQGPGAVGVWTKADSVTAFDNFSFGSK